MKNTNKISLFLILAIFLFLIFSFSKTTEKTSEPKDDSQNSQMSSGVFKNPDFTFNYPENLIQKDYGQKLAWRTNTSVSGENHASILLPQSIQSGTNFGDARFSVGSSSEEVAIEECLIPTNGERAKGEVTINGVNFKKITLTEVGLGNYYDSTSYRTIHDGKCYVVEYTIHSVNLRNFDPSQNIQEFDTEFVVETLESMVKSFKFI